MVPFLDNKNKIRILTYHRIVNLTDDFILHRGVISATPVNFERQIKFLSKNYNLISFDHLKQAMNAEIKLPQKSVIITFDDGYKDNYINAFPILQKYGASATFFLTLDFVEGNIIPWWDELASMIHKATITGVDLADLGYYVLKSKKDRLLIISKINEKLKSMESIRRIKNMNFIRKKLKIDRKENTHYGQFMSWDNIKEMNKKGMHFGAHTITHCNFEKESIKMARQEIVESKKKIEQKLKKDILTFCYPYGKKEFFSQDIINLLKKHGFFCAV